MLSIFNKKKKRSNPANTNQPYFSAGGEGGGGRSSGREYDSFIIGCHSTYNVKHTVDIKEEPKNEKLQCGYCNSLNAPEALECRNCGSPDLKYISTIGE